MINGILAAAAALVLFSNPAFASPEIDFDQGVDLGPVVETIKDRARAAEAVPEGGFQAQWRTERDCASFSFDMDAPELSETVLLESREYQDRCYPAGPRGERHCHEEWVNTERRRVRVRVSGRGAMLPWERDVFEVCLDGRWLNAWVVDASHRYDLRLPDSWNGGIISAVAGAKTPSNPDPSGVFVSAFQNGAGHFVLDFQDRWASYYGSDKLEIELKLVRYHKNWFDSTVLEKTVSFDSADSYRVNFADYAAELGGKLKKGKKYYAKWRFRRAGSVSKNSWMGWWESPKADYGAGASALTAEMDAPFRADAKVCWLREIDAKEGHCVYRCAGGSEHRTPVREPDPFDRDRVTVPCPQLVVPF